MGQADFRFLAAGFFFSAGCRILARAMKVRVPPDLAARLPRRAFSAGFSCLRRSFVVVLAGAQALLQRIEQIDDVGRPVFGLPGRRAPAATLLADLISSSTAFS